MHHLDLFQDNKHFIGVGELELPTAALDRGCKALSITHTVSTLDHDFTKAKLVPSVTLCLKLLKDEEPYSSAVCMFSIFLI